MRAENHLNEALHAGVCQFTVAGILTAAFRDFSDRRHNYPVILPWELKQLLQERVSWADLRSDIQPFRH